MSFLLLTDSCCYVISCTSNEFFNMKLKMSQKEGITIKIRYQNPSKTIGKKQPPEAFCEEGVLRHFTKFTGKDLSQSLSLIKLQTWDLLRFFVIGFWNVLTLIFSLFRSMDQLWKSHINPNDDVISSSSNEIVFQMEMKLKWNCSSSYVVYISPDFNLQCF